MNELNEEQVLTERLRMADGAFAPQSADPPRAVQLASRAAARCRSRRVGASLMAVFVAVVASASLLPRGSDPVPVASDTLAEFRAAMDRFDASLADVPASIEPTAADLLEVRSLVAALELEAAQSRLAETNQQLAELEASMPAVELPQAAICESAALRLKIAKTFEQYNETELARVGYQRLVASDPGTIWADEAQGRLAMLVPRR